MLKCYHLMSAMIWNGHTSTNESLEARFGCCFQVRHVLLIRRLQPCGEDLQLQVVSVSPGGDVYKSASHMPPPLLWRGFVLWQSRSSTAQYLPSKSSVKPLQKCLGSGDTWSGLIPYVIMYTWRTRRKEFHEKAQSSWNAVGILSSGNEHKSSELKPNK